MWQRAAWEWKFLKMSKCSTFSHLLSLDACSHDYTQSCLRSLRSQRFPRSHSWGIVSLWCQTIRCFCHVRQLIPRSLRSLDSTLFVWIWRRAGAGDTMPCSCPELHIKHGHRLKILPTVTMWDNKALWAGVAATCCASLCICVYRAVMGKWSIWNE